MTNSVSSRNDNYDGSDVNVFRDTEHIRQRPEMYIGGTDIKALHHLFNELIANSLDEALAGYAKHIGVRIGADGSLSVTDDGRGIPVEMHPTEKISTLEVVMTKVGAGAKFGKGTYKVSAGLHGMGAKAVTALSEWCEARVHRNGRIWSQEYERGKAVTPVRDIGVSKITGTQVRFKPDPDFFANLTFDFNTIEERVRELAFLNKNLAITLHDERIGKEETFKYDGGLVEYVNWVNRTEDSIINPISFNRKVEDIQVEFAFQHTKNEVFIHRCYTNNAYNREGGLHLAGFCTGLTRTLNKYGQRENMFKNITPIREDFLEGLTLVVAVQVPDPKFSSQEKVKLVNPPEVERLVANIVSDTLATYLEENPKEAQIILRKALMAAEAREAATKAKQALRDRKNILSGGGLPGKLYDCSSRERDSTELFLVEGDSAGGSAEAGRDRRFQAVLPLRGKPLNVEKARFENIIKNEEIANLISAIGIDIGNIEDITRLRYGKIIIMTDADVDGQHIRTLLLTFFYRQMARLVIEGKVFVARPPLFKVVQKKETRFVQAIEKMHEELMDRGIKGTRLIIHPVGGKAIPDPFVFEGEELAKLIGIVNRLENSLVILERTGINLSTFIHRATDKGLPSYRFIVNGREEFCDSVDEAMAFRKQMEEKGKILVNDNLAYQPFLEVGSETYREQEIHEVRKINRDLQDLKQFNLFASDLIPPVRIAGREPSVRMILENGDQNSQLETLRDLMLRIRRQGEKGMTITRFKGLGEMDPEELWDTTLNPETRILQQVRLDDVVKAEDMFRTLMGDKVEPRRDFIMEHAINAKEIDIHGG
jgi:DNA gyrase subunit B